MKIMELPALERPRERMLKNGREALSTQEILAILIGSGGREKSAMELAIELMSVDSRGICFLAECTPEELMAIEGIGEAKACKIMAAVELGKRLASTPPVKREVISCSQDVADLFMERMRYYKKEYFFCLLLNAKGELISEEQISVGDLSSSTTHPREVFNGAVRRSAGSVIFVHNHPSGDPTPSSADISTTRRLMDVGNLLGIPVLDHIVIGDGCFTSMNGEGLMENFEE